MSTPCVILLINLLQDVNILRPIAYIASRDLGLDTRFLVTRAFIKGDKDGRWLAEITEIGQAVEANVNIVENEGHALQVLQGLSGLIVAGSESNLYPHKIVHNIFRLKPPSFVAMTLQHGFECVGFLQSRDHDLAHGRDITFAADIVCSWCEPDRLTALAPSQRNKLRVTGPTALLQQPPRQKRQAKGIVCENLHSVRLNVSGDFKTDFVSVFGDFCDKLAEENKDVVLRPHPAGQYMLKNDVSVPSNVILNNNPIYKVDLGSYAYGISAPSSVLIDMVLAGIPTAVWRDRTGIMDADNYQGLTSVSDLDDWVAFAREASLHPERFVQRQADFLSQQMMVTDSADVFRRFAELLWSAARRAAPTLRRPLFPPVAKERILFIANGYLPTLQLSFVKPLTDLVEAGRIDVDFVLEQEIKDFFAENGQELLSLDERLRAFRPTILVFCRYSGPHADYLTRWAHDNAIPTVFHIDDDLLNIPLDLGKAKHAYHNDPKRLSTVRHLLDKADVVYCSNENLHRRLGELGARSVLKTGKIYASGQVIVPAREKPALKVGYMASADHTHNLEMIKPALIDFLRRNANVTFELFGSIPKLKEFDEFGDRVTKCPPISNYNEFMEAFAALEWDIGVCPLVATPFNVVKSNTKWVEYTSVGAAVVASRNTVYDECCADECGILADTNEEWLAALELLSQDKAARYNQVKRAQEKLASDYTIDRLREQVLSVFDEAKTIRQSGLRQLS